MDVSDFLLLCVLLPSHFNSSYHIFQASFQKSQIEREVEEHKQKLLRSEQSLQVSQTKEQDLRKKMEVGCFS